MIRSILVRRAGRLDGKAGIPAWDDPAPPPFLREIEADGAQRLAALQERFAKADRPLLTRFTDARAIHEHDEEKLVAAKNEMQRALDETELRTGSRPTVVRPINTRRYFLLMGLLAVLESPINYGAFAMLGLPVPLQMLLALIFGGVIVVAAHFAGSLLRQRQHVAAGLLIAGIIVVVIGLGFFREAYSKRLERDAAVADAAELTASDPALRGGKESGPTEPGSIPSYVHFGLFAAVNLLAATIAICSSFGVHDPVSVSCTDLRRAETRAARSKDQVEVRRNSRISCATTYGAKAKRVLGTQQRLFSEYWRRNLLSRDVAAERKGSSDPLRGQPAGWDHQLSLRVPPELSDPETALYWG